MCSLLQLPNKVICNYNKASLWEERRRDIGFLGELVIRCNALLAVSTYFYLLAASVKWPGGLSPGQREALSQLLCWQSREAGVSSAAGTRSLRGSWSSVARQGTPQRQVCEECYPLAFQVRHAFFCCFCFVFLTLREAAIARMLFFFLFPVCTVLARCWIPFFAGIHPDIQQSVIEFTSAIAYLQNVPHLPGAAEPFFLSVFLPDSCLSFCHSSQNCCYTSMSTQPHFWKKLFGIFSQAQ